MSRIGRLGRATALLGVVLACLAALPAALAQPAPGLAPGDPPLPAAAAAAWQELERLSALAVVSDPPWHPDAPAWAPVLTAVRAAERAAPGHPAVLRVQLRSYALTGWWVRAADVAEALAAARPDDPWADGEVLLPDGPSTRELAGRTFSGLGFVRYQADGPSDDALNAYLRWLEVMPDEPEALRWVGRLRLERQDPQGALPYWRRLLELLPDDAGARFFLDQADIGSRYGPEASAAFQEGLTAYRAGDLPTAAERFELARQRAPSFAEAHAWAGAVALERAMPAEAVVRYQRAVELRPEEPTWAFFLRQASTQAEHGIAAAEAFFAGLNLYEAGEADDAMASFETAVEASATFAEAWAWLGRVRQEQGLFEAAETAWATAVSLRPDDDNARSFLQLAQHQSAYQAAEGGSDAQATAAAAVDFAAGVAAFERSELEEAVARFRAVVNVDPGSGLGWTWLGRVAYTLRDFDLAADAYAVAAALAPGDDDLAWFAEDAAFRAGRLPPEDAETEDAEPEDGPLEEAEPDEESS